MTDFNSLPNETLQRIVDCCYEADEMNRMRMEEQAKGQPKTKHTRLSPIDSDKISQGWGRSCSAISRTSKRLRSLAAKHLFSTLVLAQVDATIFKCSILHSTLRLSFTRLVLSRTYLLPSASDFVLFCQFSPLLPNIRTLAGIDDKVLKTLCGPNGLLPPTSLGSRPTPIDTYLEREENRTHLLRLASQVNELDVSMSAEQLAILLRCNPRGLHTLRVVAKSEDRFSILQGTDTSVPVLIAQCSNLKRLTIVESCQYRGDEWDDEETIDPVHEGVLDIPYSFANSLISLTLELAYHPYQPTFNELKFIALFPSLKHLSLASGWRADQNQELDPLSLPHLTTLDISCPCGLGDGVAVLGKLALPSILSLKVKAIESALIPREVDMLADLLQTWNVPTLRYLSYESLTPLYSREVATLQSATASPLLVSQRPKALLKGARKPRAPPGSSSFDTSDDQVDRILDWASGYATKLRASGDRSAVHELLGSMKALEDRMEWLMD